MQTGIKNIWNRSVQYYLDHYAPVGINNEEGLPYLGDKLFISITLYQSRKAGLITVFINALIFVTTLWVLPFISKDISVFQQYSGASSLVVGADFIAFNALLVLSVAHLVDELYH